MAAAVILHISSILLITGPSFIIYFNTPTRDIRNFGLIITWIHAIVGLLSAILGIYLVATWRFQAPPKMDCARRKRLMKPTLTLWALTLILG